MRATPAAPLRPSGRLILVLLSYRLTDFPTPSLPTSLHVAHAPDGAHGVETRRLVVWIETDVLVRVPEVRFAGEKIFGLERFLRVQPPLRQRQMEPGLVGIEGIEIRDDQYPVGAIGCGLAIGGDVLVVAGVEAQIVVEVQSRMLAADGIDTGDIGDDVPRPVPVPDLVLVLLGVEVFLPAWDGRVLAQLITGVDAVDGRERRRQGETHLERGAATLLQDERQDVVGV